VLYLVVATGRAACCPCPCCSQATTGSIEEAMVERSKEKLRLADMVGTDEETQQLTSSGTW
jgi:hypothetical protein